MEKTLSEDYCSYEVSKLLKEKGFDEFCGSIYIILPNGDYRWSKIDVPHKNSIDAKPISIMCPTHQMAMKWLRERHIIIVIVPTYFNNEQCAYWDIDIWVDGDYKHPFEDYPTYEQAADAALKFCLTEIL